MAHAGPDEAHDVVYPLHLFQKVFNHRKLMAKTFPQSVSAAMTDDPISIGIQDQQEMFHCAASQGILSSVLELLADGRLSRDLPDRFGRTPLHWAAEQGHLHVVFALLRAGVRVDPRCQRNATPLMLAAFKGHEEVVGLLLQYRASESDCWPGNRHFRGREHWRSTALHYAADGLHVGVLEILFDVGFDGDQRDRAGLTAAEVAARKSDLTSWAVTHLADCASDRGRKLVRDPVSMTMQEMADVHGLVKFRVHPGARNEPGDTVVHSFVRPPYPTVMAVLLRSGASISLCDQCEDFPLNVAVCAECGEIVASREIAGDDLEPRAVGRDSPLHTAVVMDRATTVSLLLGAGVSTEQRDTTHGQTPLSWACEGGLAPIVRLLVQAGADVESRSSAGLTPLHWACRLIDAESVDILLGAGADPGAVDRAAAKNEVENASSSRSNAIASLPIASDVIGLGYPPDRAEDSRLTFPDGSESLEARLSDLVSVKRIQLALHATKKECSWRRRGWLVILATRQVAAGVRADAAFDRSIVFRGGCSPLLSAAVQPSCVYTTIVEHPPCTCQQAVATSDELANASTNKYSSDSPDARNPQQELSSGNKHNNCCAGKRLRYVGNASAMVARATSHQQGQARGDSGCEVDVAVRLPELVDALLGLAAGEVGVFRRVVMFV